jgi:hypothetical protein
VELMDARVVVRVALSRMKMVINHDMLACTA